MNTAGVCSASWATREAAGWIRCPSVPKLAATISPSST